MYRYGSRIFLLALAAGLVFAQPDLPDSLGPLTVDGKLDDEFWRSARAETLSPADPGVPAEMGGDVYAGVWGGYLCFAARMPEEGGRVLARSIGRNPTWEWHQDGSPPVEDRVQFEYSYRSSGGEERSLVLTVNPWGAYRVEQDGLAAAGVTPLVAAVVSDTGWVVETALPLEPLDVERGAAGRRIGTRAERIRSRRPLAPEFRWIWPEANSGAGFLTQTDSGSLPAPAYQPPELGNTEPPLEVGRVTSVPPMPEYLDPSAPMWNDSNWAGIPALRLPRNEPYARDARYATEVRWVHDTRTLALLIRVAEPEPLVAERGGRDAGIDADDHVAIHLATTGPSFLEIAVNPAGAIRDWRGSGIHSVRRPDLSWNFGIDVRTRISSGEWIVRMDLPLRECAEALGETGVPEEWRVLISRYRAPRGGEPAEVSALPPVGTETFYGPLRYRRMKLAGRPVQTATGADRPALDGLAQELAALETRVWPDLYRRYHGVRTMVRRQQRARAERAILEERRTWEEIDTLEEWEAFRAQQLERLRQAVGGYPPARPPLDVRITATHRGDGYRLQNLVYQSREGFYVTANLYLPERPSPPMAGIIIQHSFHAPKTQGELQDMGQLWARSGAAVLIPERFGFGERVETAPWYRYPYNSRHIFEMQLGVAGETHMGWMAWDLIRGVDMLLERPDIDAERIVLVGAVAGGGEPAAIAAALDERIDAVIPYNYDHGRVRLGADFPGELAKLLTMSVVTGSIAPRKYVRAFEFGWEGAAQPDYPDLWVDAWERSKKVWGLYGALENLASAQGFGLIRLSMERVSHCMSIGAVQRCELHSTLERWFDIPAPVDGGRRLLPDSRLSVNPYREEARRQEAERRRPHAELRSISPETSAELRRRPLHGIAHEMGRERLERARASRAGLTAAARRRGLESGLAKKLGDIVPTDLPRADIHWRKRLSRAEVEAVALAVEDGIDVPLLLIRPAGESRLPVVVASAKGGKDRFLASRTQELARLLEAGIAVCLPDVRGTGETAPEPDWQNDGAGLYELELALGSSVVGARLKDLRTVLAYLKTRDDLDPERIALWGDSFAPANSRNLRVDELRWESGPQIQYHSEPMGATLALLAALFEDDIAAVAAQRGLAGYLALLSDAFVYAPKDAMVHGILEAGDIADIAAGIAPRPLLLGGFVNGRNVRLEGAELDGAFGPVREAYGQGGRLRISPEDGDAVTWLVGALR